MKRIADVSKLRIYQYPQVYLKLCLLPMALVTDVTEVYHGVNL